jgi:hypothetical protein
MLRLQISVLYSDYINICVMVVMCVCIHLCCVEIFYLKYLGSITNKIPNS